MTNHANNNPSDARTTALLCALALGLATLLGGCAKKEQSEGTPAGSAPKTAPSQDGTRVEVARVETSSGVVKIVRPGEVKGAREADLASALGGFVERVLVDTGSAVKKNQVIAYVDSSTHASQAKLTRVELDEAKRELARLEGLGKAVASARVDTARSRLSRAKAQHSMSSLRQSRAAIRAPFAGEIVGLHVERGEVLAPGNPVGRLVQLDKVHVEVSATDRDIAVLKVGGAAAVTTAATGDPIGGTIARIEQAADKQTRTFKVEVAVDNAERRLLPGMIAQVTFSNDRVGDAIFLPQELLVTQLDGNGLFAVEEKDSILTASWRPVTLGAIVGLDVEISTGITKGDRIVVLGQRSLVDGDPLIVTREGSCCINSRVAFDDPVAKAQAASEKARDQKKAPQEKNAEGDKKNTEGEKPEQVEVKK